MKELKERLEWKEGIRRRKGTRDECRKRMGREALKDHNLHELIRTRE